jgi:Holliday junction resolvase RusA-like endonuclease
MSKKNTWRPGVSGRGRLFVYQSNKQVQSYVMSVRLQAKSQSRITQFKKIDRPQEVALAARVYFDPAQHAMDVHNAVETILDAMQGVVYDDDNQVVGMFLPPQRLIDAKRPRIEVDVWRASEAEQDPHWQGLASV